MVVEAERLLADTAQWKSKLMWLKEQAVSDAKHHTARLSEIEQLKKQLSDHLSLIQVLEEDKKLDNDKFNELRKHVIRLECELDRTIFDKQVAIKEVEDLNTKLLEHRNMRDPSNERQSNQNELPDSVSTPQKVAGTHAGSENENLIIPTQIGKEIASSFGKLVESEDNQAPPINKKDALDNISTLLRDNTELLLRISKIRAILHGHNSHCCLGISLISNILNGILVDDRPLDMATSGSRDESHFEDRIKQLEIDVETSRENYTRLDTNLNLVESNLKKTNQEKTTLAEELRKSRKQYATAVLELTRTVTMKKNLIGDHDNLKVEISRLTELNSKHSNDLVEKEKNNQFLLEKNDELESELGITKAQMKDSNDARTMLEVENKEFQKKIEANQPSSTNSARHRVLTQPMLLDLTVTGDSLFNEIECLKKEYLIN